MDKECFFMTNFAFQIENFMLYSASNNLSKKH